MTRKKANITQAAPAWWFLHFCDILIFLSTKLIQFCSTVLRIQSGNRPDPGFLVNPVPAPVLMGKTERYRYLGILVFKMQFIIFISDERLLGLRRCL
jgi:hypothetical protein